MQILKGEASEKPNPEICSGEGAEAALRRGDDRFRRELFNKTASGLLSVVLKNGLKN